MQATVRLSSGHDMPMVALGSFKCRGDDVQAAVAAALSAGYRHIDTASVYRNEEKIGAALERAIAAGRITREDLFVTTKIGPKQHGLEAAYKGVQTALHKLGLSYVDLVLIHWPGVQGKPPNDPSNAETRRATWRGLEQAVGDGLVRSIGTSNYNEAHLDDLMSYASIRPAVNQCEFHVQYPQEKLRSCCQRHQVVFQAYSSLGTGQLLTHPTVVATATAAGLSPAQLLLSWARTQGVPVIPKSRDPQRIAENLRLQMLPASVMEALAPLGTEQRQKLCWDSSKVR